MNPLEQFRRLANRPALPKTGRVVSVSADAITVSLVGFSNRKLRRQAGDATNYQRGDSVYIDEQTVRGRVRAQPEVYVL